MISPFVPFCPERGVRDGERSAAFPRLCGFGARPVQRAVSSLFSVAPRFPFPSGTGSVPFRRGKNFLAGTLFSWRFRRGARRIRRTGPGRARGPGVRATWRCSMRPGPGFFEGAGKGGNAALFFSARFPLLRPAFLSRYVRFRTRGQRRSCSSRHSCTALARASRSGEKGRSRCSTR